MSYLEDQEVVLKFADLGSAFALPFQVHATDAGFDLYVSENTLVEPGAFVDVPSSVAVQLPPNCWGLLTGRSSALRKHGLLVNQGVIDHGYTGELYAGVWNLGSEPVTVERGWRLAQLIPVPQVVNPVHKPVQSWAITTEELEYTPRGTNGFGSTGV